MQAALARRLQEQAISQRVLSGRSIEVTIRLDPVEVGAWPVPEGQPRMKLRIRAADRHVSADIATKSLRKAAATIRESGPDACIAVVRGKLGPGDAIESCGLVVQLKAQPQTAA